MTTRPAAILAVRLDDDQLRDLARLVANELLARNPGDTYDQDHLPTGVTRRVFLDAARRGAFRAVKVGRNVVARRADVEAWMAAHPMKTKTKAPKGRRRPGGADPELAKVATDNGARLVG